ncbi:MAG: GNAT family N-acetyltransferase [Balneolaceae bacterium]
MNKFIKTFSELSPQQLYDVLRLRQNVFIIEQNCIYADIDDSDNQGIHILFYEGDSLAAYARIFGPDIKFENACAIGRIIVSPAFRGTGLGRQLITESIEWCKKEFVATDIQIEAQALLINYYQQFGFIPIGNIYPVDGIDHIQMVIPA